MKGFQRQYLKGLAHGLKPVVFIGQKGLGPALLKAIDEALDAHELIKIKFNDYKEKARKQDMADSIAAQTGCLNVGMLGHILICFRPQKDPEKRRISLPERTNP